MPVYEVLKNGKVVNRIMATAGFMEANFDEYRLIEDPTPVVLPSYSVTNEEITINGTVAQKTLSGDYDSAIGDNITIEFTLVDGQHIDYGDAVLKVPMIRYADGQKTDSEMYLSATIKAGVMLAVGSTPYSGNWRLTATRINSALTHIDADWQLDTSTDDVSFLV